jgi:hypothetical protein
MPEPARANIGLKERILAELRVDKKKTAIMGALLLVAVGLGARAVIKMSGGETPAAAQAGVVPGAIAMPAVSAAPSASPAGLPTVPSPDFAQAPSPSPSAATPAGMGLASASLKTLRPRAKITQDIFALKLDYFPLDQEANAPATVAIATTQAVDANIVRASAVQAKAKALVLQSTIISQRPKAVINGQIVGVKDTILGFEVVEVTGRSCVLELDGVQVRLAMKDE